LDEVLRPKDEQMGINLILLTQEEKRLNGNIKAFLAGKRPTATIVGQLNIGLWFSGIGASCF
jgi:hypothetical protein